MQSAGRVTGAQREVSENEQVKEDVPTERTA